MVPVWLLLFIFVACAAISFLLCGLARTIFPKFRSGEYKPGPHRSDLPASGREIKTIELPLVGGPALTLAAIIAGIGAGFLFNLSTEQWALLSIGLGATIGYMLIGFADDWHKVFSKEGLRERDKFIAVLLVSLAVACAYFFFVSSARVPYVPYIDLPFIGKFLCSVPHSSFSACVTLVNRHPVSVPVQFPQPAYFIWLFFLMVMTGLIGSATSLSVDFSDGLDGLAGGLVFSAAIAFGIVITGIIRTPEGFVLEILSLICASSALGYLPWNWPSAWAARRGTAKRRAKIYMGDSGALALGGLLAMIAIFSRQEALLPIVGGAFVLEGASALIQSRLLTRFFRHQLHMIRFASLREHIPHTEFPLPFLATPLHHHFDLLGWDRRRLVYGAWALGACFALMGVMIGLLSGETWQRYLLRILALMLIWAIWSSGSWTRRYFVGKHPAERTRRRRLALFYGYPYKIMGIRLCHLVEIIEASEDRIETPIEEVALWQRMNIFDARAMLGLYCYRAGYYPAALAQWTRIPESNRALRPEIAKLLTEVDNRLALEKQETQPMRRDQILREEPILSGNLPPADLPNPHTPISNEEKMDGHGGDWVPSPLPLYDGEDDEESEEDEQNAVTSPLHNDGASAPTSQKDRTASNGSTSPIPTTQESWIHRLIRLTPGK